MKSTQSFFKFFSIPLGLALLVLSFSIYMSYQDSKINSTIVEKALIGNQYAIAILQTYEKPSKLDRKVLTEALKGNPYALEILKINHLPSDLE